MAQHAALVVLLCHVTFPDTSGPERPTGAAAAALLSDTVDCENVVFSSIAFTIS